MNPRSFVPLLGTTALALLAGCGDPFSNAPFYDDEAFLEALPQSEELLIDEPEESTATARISTGDCAEAKTDSSSTECDPNAYHDITFEMTTNVNGYILNMLELLDQIRSHPPTTRTEDSRIWGPWLIQDEGVYMRLEILRESPSYTYALFLSEQQNASGDVVMSGTYLPGSVAEEGVGAFTFDFTVRATYFDDATQVGTIDVDYDTSGAQIDFVLQGYDVGHEGGDVNDESYAYYAPGDGSGYFYFSKPVNVSGSEEVLEQLSIWSSWEATGRGRADLLVEGGDLGTYKGSGIECWSSTGDPDYYVSPGCSEIGDASLCIASTQGWNTQ